MTQESLRAAIGMVTQDTSLLHRSIAANIRYGRPDASDARGRRPRRARRRRTSSSSGLRDWKDRTGYDAHVGERGVKLSGGQRQRIAIARVILKDAPILVLDEATSALDSEVELAIQEQLLDLMEGKTVIAIAHRLSTIARMDRLIVLEQGRIVEQGTHDELLRLGGHYEKLWRHQSGGFLARRCVRRGVRLAAACFNRASSYRIGEEELRGRSGRTAWGRFAQAARADRRGARRRACARDATLPSLRISSREKGDLIMLGIGGFTPLEGFMTRADWEGVCDELCARPTGLFWPIPITLSTDDHRRFHRHGERNRADRPGWRRAARDA